MKRGVVGRERAIHLVRRDMVEAVRRSSFFRRATRCAPPQQRVGAQHVGAMNASGPRMERSTCDSAAKCTMVSSCSSRSSRSTSARSQISPCTKRNSGSPLERVRGSIDCRHRSAHRGRPRAPGPAQPVMHEVRADETGAAGDEKVSHAPSPRASREVARANGRPARPSAARRAALSSTL